MKTRKLVLIIADVLLLAVCIIQFVLSAHDTTKYFDLKETPDMIIIDTPEEKGITVVFENDQWYVGQNKFPVNQKVVDEFLDAINAIRVLDKVGSTGNDAILERYELNDVKKTVVTASKNGKVLRTLSIGKEAVSNSQSYITVDGGKDIYLATGNLPYVFKITENEIRSEVVMSLTPSEITEISVTNAEGEVSSVSRMGSGEDVVWNSSDSMIDIDSDKASNWFISLANLNTRNWYAENEVPAGEKILTAKITHAFKNTTLEFYALPVQEGIPQAYYGRSSDVDYAFAVESDYIQSIQKTISELAK